MICPICGSTIKDDLKFCGKCGSQIPRCPTCGKALDKKTRFCGYDGTAIPESVLALFREDAAELARQAPEASEDARGAKTDAPGAKTDAPDEDRPSGAPRAQTAADAGAASRVRYCGKCGKPCDDEQAVCSRCRQLSAAVGAEGAAPGKPAKKKGGAKYALVALAALLVVAAGSAAAYYFINGELPFISQLKGPSADKDSDRPDEREEPDEKRKEEADDPDDGEGGAEPETGGADAAPGGAGGGAAAPDETAAELFSSDVAQDIAGQLILGAPINDAAVDGWAEQWMRLYYYGGTDEQSQAAQQRTRGIPFEAWLQGYVPYEHARDAGWGNAWLTLAAGLSNGSAAGTMQQSAVYAKLLDFVNNCDSRYFAREDLEGLDASMAILARNAPYAHAGRKFTTDTIRSFFEQFSWYHPLIEADAFQETMLNSYETANKNLVVDFEKEKGYK